MSWSQISHLARTCGPDVSGAPKRRTDDVQLGGALVRARRRTGSMLVGAGMRLARPSDEQLGALLSAMRRDVSARVAR